MNVIDIFSNILLHLSTYAYLYLYSTVLAHVNECTCFISIKLTHLYIVSLAHSLSLFHEICEWCLCACKYLSLSQNFSVCANSNEESTFVCKCVACTASGATYSVNAFDDPIIEYENTRTHCRCRYVRICENDTVRVRDTIHIL